MLGYRSSLAFLLAFAIMVAPLAGSWAAGAPCTVSMVDAQAVSSSFGAESPVAHKASDAHCDDGNQLCPPEFCDTKCFPSLHLSSFAQTKLRVTAINQLPNEPARLRASPDRRDQPPPRT